MPQSLSNILVHLVFSTKARDPALAPAIREELYPYLATVLKNLNCPVLQVGGVEDHVHILFRLSRTLTIAEVVEKVKSSSSRWLKSKGLPSFAWQAGYGAMSLNEDGVAACVRYIQGQEEHHRKVSFQEEFRELLRIAGIEFDDRYVWD
ncbi:MAG: IS200/IS605 family transposase [Armatimonadetes bacterium]|nr:IS200/IS605 family transposase [Armatimonadota bacterium]